MPTTSRGWAYKAGGFESQLALDHWFEFLAWSGSPDNDPDYYDWRAIRPARAANVLPFIEALADLLVADLLRVGPGKV